MEHQDKFDRVTTIGLSGPVKGEYYGLPWPCWGTAQLKHPGTPLLYAQDKPVSQGGLPFRAAWGLEHDGVRLLAEHSAPKDSPVQDGYPEFTYGMIQKLGWEGEFSNEERAAIRALAEKTLASHQTTPQGPVKHAGGEDGRRIEYVGASREQSRPVARSAAAGRVPPPQQPGTPSAGTGAPPGQQQQNADAQKAARQPTSHRRSKV